MRESRKRREPSSARVAMLDRNVSMWKPFGHCYRNLFWKACLESHTRYVCRLSIFMETTLLTLCKNRGSGPSFSIGPEFRLQNSKLIKYSARWRKNLAGEGRKCCLPYKMRLWRIYLQQRTWDAVCLWRTKLGQKETHPFQESMSVNRVYFRKNYSGNSPQKHDIYSLKSLPHT